MVDKGGYDLDILVNSWMDTALGMMVHPEKPDVPRKVIEQLVKESFKRGWELNRVIGDLQDDVPELIFQSNPTNVQVKR